MSNTKKIKPDEYKLYIRYKGMKDYEHEFSTPNLEEIKDLIRAFERRRMIVDFYVKYRGEVVTISPYSRKGKIIES